jgi:hypothetical protein
MFIKQKLDPSFHSRMEHKNNLPNILAILTKTIKTATNRQVK